MTMQETNSVDASRSDDAPDQYEVTIRNCNSIEEVVISLRRSALNIKYGPNGIGKSTIARALVLNSEESGGLEGLLPFKYRAAGGHRSPSVEGAGDLQRILVFDDEYVSQFVFQPDEVVKNSFEIFIGTDEYKQGMSQIEGMFRALKEALLDDVTFQEAVSDLTQLRDAFKFTKTGAISKASMGSKALGVGGRLDNIPEPLQGYAPFLQGEDPAGWVSWQSKGKAFLELSNNCPYCSESSMDKTTARSVSDEYESAAVKNMGKLRDVITRLGVYLEPGCLDSLNEILGLLGGPTREQENFIFELHRQVDTFLAKLADLRGLSFYALRNIPAIGESLRDLRIDLSLLRSLNSDATRAVVELVNRKLDEVAGQVSVIQQRVGDQVGRVRKLIRENEGGINDFLESAGYRYSVSIETDGASYRMILQHNDAPGHLGAAAQHLSYGERNAFALVLFMHYAKSVNPDLVVLDDPVSSFDNTKKFAIMHQLFRGPNSLRDVTSLLLTHDIEPAIDTVRSGASRKFKEAHPVVHFLSARDGIVSERLITGDDIMSFSQVCDANIAASTDDAIKCIYLRRKFELHGGKGPEYDVLSSLLHLREVPTYRHEGDGFQDMSEDSVHKGTLRIQEDMPSFDYRRVLDEISELELLRSKFESTSVGYEKLQIFRMLSRLIPQANEDDAAFRKFVNESFHIENEYVMQLDPQQFDTVPQHVVDRCSAIVAGAVDR